MVSWILNYCTCLGLLFECTDKVFLSLCCGLFWVDCRLPRPSSADFCLPSGNLFFFCVCVCMFCRTFIALLMRFFFFFLVSHCCENVFSTVISCGKADRSLETMGSTSYALSEHCGFLSFFTCVHVCVQKAVGSCVAPLLCSWDVASLGICTATFSFSFFSQLQSVPPRTVISRSEWHNVVMCCGISELFVVGALSEFCLMVCMHVCAHGAESQDGKVWEIGGKHNNALRLWRVAKRTQVRETESLLTFTSSGCALANPVTATGYNTLYNVHMITFFLNPTGERSRECCLHNCTPGGSCSSTIMFLNINRVKASTSKC